MGFQVKPTFLDIGSLDNINEYIITNMQIKLFHKAMKRITNPETLNFLNKIKKCSYEHKFIRCRNKEINFQI